MLAPAWDAPNDSRRSAAPMGLLYNTTVHCSSHRVSESEFVSEHCQFYENFLVTSPGGVWGSMDAACGGTLSMTGACWPAHACACRIGYVPAPFMVIECQTGHTTFSSWAILWVKYYGTPRMHGCAATGTPCRPSCATVSKTRGLPCCASRILQQGEEF